MLINSNDIDSNTLYSSEDKFLKKYGNIYISDEQLNILKKYDIDINKYKNVSELIYDIEEYLNDSYQSMDDLEWVSETLSEYNYYNNTNK